MKNIAMIFALVFVLVSCGSTTWDNMSESDIATWKELGVSMEDANEMNEEGVYAKEFGEWKAVKITDLDSILEWKEEKFNAAQAGRWAQANFDVDDAIEARGKGLQPVHKAKAPEMKKEEPKETVKEAVPAEAAPAEVVEPAPAK